VVDPRNARPGDGGDASGNEGSTSDGTRVDGVTLASRILREAGVKVFESCHGTPNPCRHKPFVRFHGEPDDGLRALDIAMRRGLPVNRLNHCYEVNDGTTCGPYWELELLRAAVLSRRA